MTARAGRNRPDARVWKTALAGVCALLLVGQALMCLGKARILQLRLDHAYVAAETVRELRRPLSERSGARQLRPTLDALLDRPELALRFVAVRDAQGVLLSRAGVFESLRLPLLPAALQSRLREVLYALAGSSGSQRVFTPDRRLLGRVDYTLAPGAVVGVQMEAIAALRIAGWLGAALALPVIVMFAIGLRRQLARVPAWVSRADPHRVSTEPDWGAGDLAEFRERAGQVMDGLRYGLIVTDREGRVRYCNATAERLTGWSAGDARGRLLHSVFHVVDAAGTPQPGPADAVLKDGKPQPTRDGLLRRRHGETIPVEISAHAMRNRQKMSDGVTLLFRDITPQQREVEQARREARLSQAVVDHLDEGLLTTDMAGVVRSANARAERMFGYPRNELVGFTITKLMPVPFLNTPTIRITDYVAGRGGGKLPKVVGWRKDATTFPVDLWVQPMRVDGADGLVVIVRDISERLRGENLATRLGRLLDTASEEVYIFDAQSLYFLEVNRGARRNLGYRPEQLARLTPLDISEELSQDSLHQYLGSLRGGDRDHLVYRCRHRRIDGSTYPVEVRLNFSRDEEPPVFMAIATDITDRLVAEDKLKELAHFDSLTGLPNRVMLYDRLQQAQLAAQRGPRMLGVFFLDLDRFKQINDLHGHEIGDQVLRAVADRLRSTVRPSDTVARLSGDEFVILAPGLRSAEDAGFLAQKLLERFEQPLDLPGLTITSRPSIGITLYPLDDTDPEGLLRHADHAMYRAKEAGRGCYRLFSAQVDPQRRRQFELEREIHAAVALNQFRLDLLPAIDGEGRPQLLLATLRWLHPRYGELEAAEIWQAASRAGLVADLELWMICQACELLHAAGQARLQQLPHLLAISGWQLRDREFLGHVDELLQRYRVPPSCLVLSLTPDGLAEAAGRHADSERLVEAGVRFALRDFSTLPAEPPLPLGYALVAPALLADDGRLRALRNAAGAITLVATGVGEHAALLQAREAGLRLASGPVVGDAVAAPELPAWLRERIPP